MLLLLSVLYFKYFISDAPRMIFVRNWYSATAGACADGVPGDPRMMRNSLYFYKENEYSIRLLIILCDKETKGNIQLSEV